MSLHLANKATKKNNIPCVVSMGGYSADVKIITEAHKNTFRWQRGFLIIILLSPSTSKFFHINYPFYCPIYKTYSADNFYKMTLKDL
jgi:hypothetical protein